MKTKAKAKTKFTLQVYKVRFELEKIPDRPGWAKVGTATLEYEKRKELGGESQIQVKLPIVSIWRDPIMGSAAKAHLAIVFRNLQHRRFLEDVIAVGKVQCPENMEIVASPDGVIKYGYQGGQPFRCKTDSTNNWKSEYIFDSKAIALDEVLVQAQGRKQLAGLQLITLDVVSESVLVEIGFERVPDIMQRSVDMWKGAPRETFENVNWRDEDLAVESFLKLLDKALKGE